MPYHAGPSSRTRTPHRQYRSPFRAFHTRSTFTDSAAAGNDQPIVVPRLNVGEGGIQGEAMTRLLRIGLIAFKIVDRSPDKLACFFVRTDGMHGVAHHLQCLEGNHRFIVFDIVADDHK